MYFITLATLLSAASALQITSPAQVTGLPVQYNNGSLTVTFTTVNTDPTVFNVNLSANGGQASQQVAQNVQSSAGSINVDLTGVAPGRNYQVNFVSVPTPQNQGGILAQSGQFQIAQGANAGSPAATTTAMTMRPTTTTARMTGSTGTGAGTNGTIGGGGNGTVTGRPSGLPSGSGAGQVTLGVAGVMAAVVAMLA